MINKRLLIKNLLAHNDENSFFDKKQKINLHLLEGKAKFLKHICALSNSNPNNNSYLIIGIEDETNNVLGVDFYDDSHIQNLVDAYLENPPLIQYENISFPHLQAPLVIGLVTIYPKKGISYFKKKCHIIEAHTPFSRRGSISHPQYIAPKLDNSTIVGEIEKASSTNLKTTLDNLVHFITIKHQHLLTNYQVFQEYYTVCWAGIEKTYKGKSFLSRVDIELINEDLKLFYSAFDEVEINYTENEFIITEYIKLGFKKSLRYLPFSIQKITFHNNMTYELSSQIVFNLPKIETKHLDILYQNTIRLLHKLKYQSTIEKDKKNEYKNLCYSLLNCYLYGYPEAKDHLIASKSIFKKHENSIQLYSSFKEVMRILRKIKYETEI